MATGASGRIVTQTSKVLIVDDEPIIRGVLVDVLLDAGFAVSSASNGLIALSVLEEWQPDIVLLDLMMPVMDGGTVARELRKLPDSGALRLVVLSGCNGNKI